MIEEEKNSTRADFCGVVQNGTVISTPQVMMGSDCGRLLSCAICARHSVLVMFGSLIPAGTVISKTPWFRSRLRAPSRS